MAKTFHLTMLPNSVPVEIEMALLQVQDSPGIMPP